MTRQYDPRDVADVVFWASLGVLVIMLGAAVAFIGAR